ncbi:retropepsin-like aspartic protease family protein [Jiella mangrovi]|uniref:TIGR02281 family clan AA aspartic protease n=1 Tax=Jiella mangrovi TaxID=2821407 RepID=A0ABS4BHM4_9HYPH|nr:TIGR02281 family clan AA aspartic protease [Jiella mangrovi]MBP0616186.1 TIGR02281 family clan AA aspartic protease [Jiella mangrovi]
MRRDIILYFVLGAIALTLALLFLDQDGRVFGMDEDSFARLAELAILGIGIGAVVVMSMRFRLGQMFSSILIWTLAFAVLIGLYAFQPEFSALKNRVFAVLMPGSVVPIGEDDGRQRFMATRASDGHFYLQGEIDGEATTFIVDTGASVVAMDSDMARSLGIDMSRLHFTNQVMTANGIARAAPIRLDEITIGGITRHGVPAAVTEGSGLDAVLLGMSFLGTLTSYDFRGDRLVLTE